MSILTMENVGYAYGGGVPVLQDVSYPFEKGKIYAIVGRSGAGKTTLLSLLSALTAPTAGRILFDAADCRTLSVAQWGELRRRSLSMLFQDLRLFGELTVAENLALKNELTHFLTPDRIERLLEAAGIAGKRDTPAGKLSFGQQQRVAFIRCLCQPFDFILLDEPVSHLDAANGEVLSALLLEGAQAQGAGVIVTSVGSRLRLPYHKIFTL